MTFALTPDVVSWQISDEALIRIRQGFAEIHELHKDLQDQARLTELRRQAVEVHNERISLLLAARKHARLGS